MFYLFILQQFLEPEFFHYLIFQSHFFISVAENYPVASSEVKSESVASLQPQASVSSIPTGSPGPKRSGTTGNTLKKWLTSPVRRLSHGKGDNANAKKPTGKQRKRDGRKSVDLGPQHEDSTEEVGTDTRHCRGQVRIQPRGATDTDTDRQQSRSTDRQTGRQET